MTTILPKPAPHREVLRLADITAIIPKPLPPWALRLLPKPGSGDTPRYMLAAVPEISEHTAEIDIPSGARGGIPVFWRNAPSDEAGEAPALYLHGVPTNSDDWVPFLERTGGLAPDLPGFGRSGKPGYLRYTIDEYCEFIERFLDTLEVQSVRLVVHDWGAVGLAFAQAHPERVERLVVMSAVPFLPDYHWHRMARLWRTPIVGELVMGSTSRRLLKRSTREANVTPGPLPDAWIDSVLDHFDQGTQRAILRLYRSSPSEVLAQAGAHLSRLDMPALVVWGLQDPYVPVHFATKYAKALPNCELIQLSDAGHWWWLDRPDAIEPVAEFLTGA